MAQPIPFHAPSADPREALRARVEGASEQHAAAILAAYDLLQALHDRGVLEVATSAVRASDDLLDKVVDSANTPQAIRALRNLMFWRQVLGRIEPSWFQGLFEAIPEGLATATAQRDEPVGIWKLVRRATNRDSLRGLAAAVDFLESFGRHLHALEASVPQGQPHLRRTHAQTPADGIGVSV
jgi:uncharacterized protein YjgD (DUF1641 family)